MKGWLLYRKEDANKNQAFIQMFLEEATRMADCDLQLVFVEELTIGLQMNQLMLQWKDAIIVLPDFVIQRSREPWLSYQLEQMGIRVYNNSLVSRICNHKATTYQYMASFQIPMIPTVFYQSDCIEEVLAREQKRSEQPLVVKAATGHGGSQVYLLDKSTDCEKIQKGLKHSDFVIQPLFGIPGRDLRVYTLGKQILCAILRTNKQANEFRANFSLGGFASVYHLNPKQEQLIHTILEALSMDLAGIDFLFQEDGSFVLNEIEDVVGTRMLHQCTDIPVVKQYLQYIEQDLNGGLR